MDIIDQLDRLVMKSLRHFAEEVATRQWRGREKEAVSLYVLNSLQPLVGSEDFLDHPSQICIEGAVKQLGDKSNRKNLVNKDLIIWGEPYLNYWTGGGKTGNSPVAILEWKYDQARRYPGDLRWLQAFSKGKDRFVGYAIDAFPKGEMPWQIKIDRAHLGNKIDNWLCIEKK